MGFNKLPSISGGAGGSSIHDLIMHYKTFGADSYVSRNPEYWAMVISSEEALHDNTLYFTTAKNLIDNHGKTINDIVNMLGYFKETSLARSVFNETEAWNKVPDLKNYVINNYLTINEYHFTDSKDLTKSNILTNVYVTKVVTGALTYGAYYHGRDIYVDGSKVLSGLSSQTDINNAVKTYQVNRVVSSVYLQNPNASTNTQIDGVIYYISLD